jgi:hypothetical protein
MVVSENYAFGPPDIRLDSTNEKREVAMLAKGIADS